MATHSTIAMLMTDGTVKQIYCHWDGYLENNGKILLKHYTDPAKIEELISLGSISQLDENVHPTEEHSFKNPQSGVVVAYHRDRDEELAIEVYPTLDDFYREYRGEEYNYLWCDGVWYVEYEDKEVWFPLKNVIETQE